MNAAEQSTPEVSVIIVNWNHGQHLPACLEALLSQTIPVEVIVVDNASQDGSADWVKRNYPEVRLLRLDANYGFSRAFNLGAQQTTSPWVMSINPDLRPLPDFCANLLEQAGKDEKIGLCAPKLLRADRPELLDSTGLFLNRWRRPYDRGQLQPDNGRLDSLTEIFGACGAAALYRRAMLEDTAVNGEYFDQDFFAYYEDADLSWRACQRGWKAVYVPEAVAEHVRGWGDTLRKGEGQNSQGPRLALRNRYLMSVKNDAWGYFLLDLPGMLIREVPRLGYMALRRPAALLGVVDLFRMLPGALRKRRQIRARQIVPDQIIRAWFLQDWNR